MTLVITILENELGVKDDNWNLAMLLKKWIVIHVFHQILNYYQVRGRP